MQMLAVNLLLMAVMQRLVLQSTVGQLDSLCQLSVGFKFSRNDRL